jgi:uroporphyrin-III C-methyltransferase/precorrin-2 dehydrogenase/sirohydrochlorin ferrochelatase
MTIASLPLFHRIAGQPVIVVGEGEAAQAKRRLVERAGGILAGEDNTQARLAFVAMDAPEQTAARLRARGLLVNVTDRPDLCDFTVPSLLDRSPVLVAVGTGGASAGLAKALRLRLETMLPQSLGQLASQLMAARAKLKARWPDARQRRQAIDQALGQGGALDLLADGSSLAVERWLATGRHENDVRSVEIRVRGTDPDELTLREARLLGSADRLAHEPGVAPAILARARADAARLAIQPQEQPGPAPGLTVILRT